MPLVVRVPYLHLRRAAQIEPGVAGDGEDSPVGPHLEVLVVLLRRERVAALESVEVESAVPDRPVRVALPVRLLLHDGALLGRRGLADDRVVELLIRRYALPELREVAFVSVEVRGPLLAFALRRSARAALPAVHRGGRGELPDAEVAHLLASGVAHPARRARDELAPRRPRDDVAVEQHLELSVDYADLLEVPHAGLADVASVPGEVLVFAPYLLVHVVAERGQHDARGPVLAGKELEARDEVPSGRDGVVKRGDAFAFDEPLVYRRRIFAVPEAKAPGERDKRARRQQSDTFFHTRYYTKTRKIRAGADD